jgi:hypothetical protein
MDATRTAGFDGELENCHEPNHPKCAACGDGVYRRARHTHVYSDRPQKHVTLCSACGDLMHVATLCVLEPIEALGMAPTARELHDLFASAKLAIAVQGKLFG